MRKSILTATIIAGLVLATPAFAADDAEKEGAVLGGTAGTVTGATVGFLAGGPIGAVIGGLSGALVGSTIGLTAANYEYIERHPVDVVVIDGSLEIGDRLPDDVEVHGIEGEDRYGYVFANDRVYVVDLDNREIVESPGEVVYAN